MSQELSSVDNPNLYLTGFMGTGKSTLGRRVAQALNYTFIDTDIEIEKIAGMKIAQIFETLGEPAFRKMERDFIESGCPDCACVVACGGGLVCREGMPELVRSKGISISLFSKPEEILERVSSNKNRPLLNVPNPLERISELMELRTQYYLKSGISISVDPDLNVTQDHILRIYFDELNRRKSEAERAAKHNSK